MPTEARIANVVPWIATSSRSSVIARAPIGLCGEPPGMTSGISGWSRLTFVGRRPGRLDIFAVDPREAAPFLAVLGDRDRIGDRLAGRSRDRASCVSGR